MTTLLQRLAAERGAGTVIALERAETPGTPEAFAARCGLHASAGIYRQVGAAEACAVVAAVLHRDLAHGVELMPSDQAGALASAFIAEYGGPAARYYTNGEFGRARAAPKVGPGWTPATDATFDTGVLILASARSACLWVQDED